MTLDLRWDDPSPIYLDFETQSACDLRAVGGRKYATHDSTRVLSLVVDIDHHYHVWFPALAPGSVSTEIIKRAKLEDYGVDFVMVWTMPDVPKPILDAARSGRTFAAHNTLGFDRHIWDRFIGLPVTWCDTLYLARLAGFPGSLDGIGRAALGAGKDKARSEIMPLTKAEYDPKRPKGRGVIDPVGRVNYLNPLPGMAGPLLRYNLVDVLRLRELYEGPLADVQVEADVIAAHVAVNERGVAVDGGLVDAIQVIASESTGRAGEVLAELTGGEINKGNYRSGPQVHAWLASKGVRLRAVDAAGNEKACLRKDVIEQALADPRQMLDADAPFAAVGEIDPVVFDVLRVRSAALRITGAKAKRASARLSPDGRVRDLFAYHQAHTGRWSSSGIQVHNLPRPKRGIPFDAILADFDVGKWGGSDARAGYDVLQNVLPDKSRLTVDDILSGLVRPCFVARPGHSLCIVDYASVECRGLAWIAGEGTLLDAFAQGVDVYKITAGRIFGRQPAEINDDERQVGKVCTLGAGYQLGAEKFAMYAAAAGINLQSSGVTSEQCIDGFRAAYPAIAGTVAGQINGRTYRRGGVWDMLNRAALAACGGEGAQEAGRCRFIHDGRTLYVELPSGRRLCYRNAAVEDRVPGYVLALGLDVRAKATVVYDNPRGYRSTLYGGKITENLVQAICRELLADAMVQMEARGFKVVLHVHDELVVEAPDGDAADTLRAMAEIMTAPPSWAEGCPIGCEGFVSKRYVKKPAPGSPTVEGKLGAIHMGAAK